MRPLRPALALLTTACLVAAASVAAASTAAVSSASAAPSAVVVTDVDGLATALQDDTALVRLGSDITVDGTLHFIGTKRLDLDGHTLVTQGVELDRGTRATIADSGTTGTLVAAAQNTSGIGISGATLIVDGGSIDAKGKGAGASGIGSTDIHEDVDADGGTLIINGGDVSATGDTGGSGIGGGNSHSAGGTVTVTGGRVSATGGDGAAGIGGIENGPGAAVTIARHAAVEADGGTGASAIGPGATTGASAAPSFGSIRLDGTLSLRGTLLVPRHRSMTIGSTGLLESGTFSGSGTIVNKGVMTSVAASDSDVTVTGHNYHLAFRSNYTGGDAAISKRVYARSLSRAQQALPTPTRSGWTFGGWKSSSKATGTSFTAASTISGNHSYYAQWKDTPRLTVALPSSLRAHKTTKVVVTLRPHEATTRPTGTVRVYYGSKYVTATYKSSSKSAMTVTIPALKKGSYSLYARYYTTDFFVGVKTTPATLKAK